MIGKVEEEIELTSDEVAALVAAAVAEKGDGERGLGEAAALRPTPELARILLS